MDELERGHEHLSTHVPTLLLLGLLEFQAIATNLLGKFPARGRGWQSTVFRGDTIFDGTMTLLLLKLTLAVSFGLVILAMF